MKNTPLDRGVHGAHQGNLTGVHVDEVICTPEKLKGVNDDRMYK